jgi:ubiquitin C-terminal hydrolase
LKRFKADYRKIKTMIDYPVKNLDISPWIEGRDESNTYRYDLYAVCLHTGTAEYGHYKAYCKHFVSGDWFEFDDGTVQKILESDVVTPSAYMLFYRRVQL